MYYTFEINMIMWKSKRSFKLYTVWINLQYFQNTCNMQMLHNGMCSESLNYGWFYKHHYVIPWTGIVERERLTESKHTNKISQFWIFEINKGIFLSRKYIYILKTYMYWRNVTSFHSGSVLKLRKFTFDLLKHQFINSIFFISFTADLHNTTEK